MDEQVIISRNDLEWATFLYNVMGEDDDYIDALMLLKSESWTNTPGEILVDFLNKWRIRVPSYKHDDENRDKGRKIVNCIDKWYSKEKFAIDSLPDSLLSFDFNKLSSHKLLADIYSTLYKIPHLGHTAAGKILHVLKQSSSLLGMTIYAHIILVDLQMKRHTFTF